MTPAERHARAKAAAHRDYRDALAAVSPGDPAAARRVGNYVSLLEQQAALAWREVRRLELRLQYPPVPGIYDGRLVEDRTGPSYVIDQEGTLTDGQEATNDNDPGGTADQPEPNRLEHPSEGTRAGRPLLRGDHRPAADPRGGGPEMDALTAAQQSNELTRDALALVRSRSDLDAVAHVVACLSEQEAWGIIARLAGLVRLGRELRPDLTLDDWCDFVENAADAS